MGYHILFRPETIPAAGLLNPSPGRVRTCNFPNWRAADPQVVGRAAQSSVPR